MFVRRKINQSGSISITVVDKSRGRYDVVKSFGTVKTAAEADLLENKAREFVREQSGEAHTIFGGMTERQMREYAATLPQGRIELAGPELFFGWLFDRLGLGSGREALFRHLVLCRLYNPGSKRRTSDYVNRYQGDTLDDRQLYSYVDSLRLGDLLFGTEEDRFHAGCFLFPLTFEPAAAADGKLPAKARGRKPRVADKQIALLLSREGRPLACRLLDAKMPEEKFDATLRRLFRKWGVTDPTLVHYEARHLPEIFRMNEMDLKMRPFNKRLKGRLEGHLCVCLAACAVQVEWEHLLRDIHPELTLPQIRKAAGTLFRLNYLSSYTGRPKSVLMEMTPLQKRIFDLVNQKYL
ncbi:MAG: hypothetical protein IKX53_03540 [Bacteroidales bacterium]|nr:hypothetical protein [Bacteroidales bacterium]